MMMTETPAPAAFNYAVVIDGHTADERTLGWGMPNLYTRADAVELVDILNASHLRTPYQPAWHAEFVG